MVDAAAAVRNRATALEDLYDEIHERSSVPLLGHHGRRRARRDQGAHGDAEGDSASWRWREDILPLLERAAELITMKDSERRSLILINPGLAPRRATVSTMYTAYRLNDADEIMPPHKHSPNAIRLGLTGIGNFTGVEGENVVFGPGDMVLTPNDAWHNHGTVGHQQATNLSVLDLPLVETLNAIHFDHDYMEEEGGKLVKKVQQSARYPADYSQAVYGKGGMVPRFVDHHRGGGLSSPMCLSLEAMEEILQKHKTGTATRTRP
ncbi:MAG: cupin domain-containing protein [Geminicoccaceae bacterium]